LRKFQVTRSISLQLAAVDKSMNPIHAGMYMYYFQTEKSAEKKRERERGGEEEGEEQHAH